MVLSSDDHLQLVPVIHAENVETWVKRMHDYLLNYLNTPKGTNREGFTARSITELAPKYVEGGISNSEMHETFFRTFWDIFIKLTQQIPYYHDGQEKAVRLLALLTGENWIWSGYIKDDMWIGLPFLHSCFQDVWHEPGPKDRINYNSWINLNSVVARLYGQGLVDDEQFALNSMRASLENENSHMAPNDSGICK